MKTLPVIDDVVACCAPVGQDPLGSDEAERLATVLKVVADPTRLRPLSILATSSEGEVCVCDLTAPVGLSQPTVSHHLKVLAGAGLVQRDKRGVWAYYRIVPSSLDALGRLFAVPAPAR